MDKVFHTSDSTKWGTPRFIVDIVKEVFDGNINVDPASSLKANEIVGADRILTEADDALTSMWFDNHDWVSESQNVFLNPPGGRHNGKSKTFLFWEQLMNRRKSFSHAIFIAFNIGSLQVSQDKGVPSMGEFPLCIPKKRLRFVDPESGERHSPPHANAIVYVPGQVNHSMRFCKHFEKVGVILNGPFTIAAGD